MQYEKVPVVYILTNKKDGVLYTGVTGTIYNRIHQHKQKTIKGFTNKYNTDKLVYLEQHQDMHAAIEREKQIKKGSRKKKIQLIEKENPEWNDLSAEWFED